MINDNTQFIPLTSRHDPFIASLIRTILKKHRLDIPGTAFFDESLDHLSAYYDDPHRAYFVLMKGENVIGGIGLAEFDGFDQCCELQKLYLAETETGQGIGYEMIRYLEDQARRMGYRQVYLETHTNLQAAIHIYERTGYQRIVRPECVVHGTMNRFYLKKLD